MRIRKQIRRIPGLGSEIPRGREDGMSFLYPLFLAGVAAVAVPILLHMIRRHTRERVAFSSLMFLRPRRPRFKSRSRLEHIPLLILRCMILCLLAFAFARPFLARPCGGHGPARQADRPADRHQCLDAARRACGPGPSTRPSRFWQMPGRPTACA